MIMMIIVGARSPLKDDFFSPWGSQDKNEMIDFEVQKVRIASIQVRKERLALLSGKLKVDSKMV